ncbi:MAG: transporter [Burkholderiales bacterium]|jgi:DHA1 family multidrug/chloramphenicol efflux transport protein-like MFS transporter|nr:transporter [Burkholderiales bacterium]
MLYSKKLYIYTAFFVLYEVSVYLSNDMIMPGMVNVIKEFHAPIQYAATSLSYFIIGGCILPLILNLVISRIGSRRVLILGNILFLFATLIITLSSNIHQFLWARFFQGMGLGFIFIGYATVHQLFDDITAIKVIALLSNISIMAPLAGPIIGAAIISSYNWRVISVFLGILGLVSLCGLYRYMPEITRDDPIPSATLSTCLKTLKDGLFLRGSLLICLSGIITVAWVGISPVIIFHTYKLSSSYYINYQILVFSGSIISSILIQFINSQNAVNIIKIGSSFALVGLIVSFIFSIISQLLCVFGLFIFTFGAGLYIGIINRIIIRHLGHLSVNLVTAITSTSVALTNCLGLETANFICLKSSYTFFSLAAFNAIIGFICFLLTRNFMGKLNRTNFMFSVQH